MTDEQYDPERDLDIVRRALDGDRVGIEQLAERMKCIPRILRVLNGRSGSPFDDSQLADLTQDVALIAWKKIGQFRGHVVLPAWLYRICLFEMRNARRKRGRMLPTVEHEVVSDDSATTWTPRDPFEHEEVHVGLSRIGRLEAHVIRLKHFRGMSFAEIAEREDLALSTVKDRYYRGVTELRPLLEQATRET